MGGPGDIGRDVSGEDAAWRELIANYDAPALPASDPADPPWPAREDLPGTAAATPFDPGVTGSVAAPDENAESGSGSSGAADGELAAGTEPVRGLAPRPGARSGPATEPVGAADITPAADAKPGSERWPGASPGPGRHATPGDCARVVRHAGDPRSYSPPDESATDDAYVPVPLPPPAKLGPVTKAAWVALIAGPAYLLLGTLLHWTISGIDALIAVAAFVGGFVTLVIRLGDHSRADDDDDGAVV